MERCKMSKKFTLVTGMLCCLLARVATAAEPDLSSPKAADKAYRTAENNADAAAMKAASVYDDAWEKVIDERINGSKAEQKLRKAVRDRWGEASKKAFPDPEIKDVPDAKEKIDGSTATLVYHGTVVERFKKVDGKWKVDLLTPISDMEMDSAKEQLKAAGYYKRAATRTAEMVIAGKCSPPADAHQALDEAYATEFNGVAAPSTRASAPTTRPAGQ